MTMSTNYRDGQRHQIGPIAIQFAGNNERGPYGIAQLASRKGTVYGLDWLMAEAIAFCVAPISDLWNASESDREDQAETGEQRGWLRLNLTQSQTKLRHFQDVLPPSKGRRIFPVARLVTDAMAGERPVSATATRTADYRAEALKKEPNRTYKQDTRKAFIDLCARLSRQRHPDLPREWQDRASCLFAAADTAQQMAVALEREIEAEDNPVTIATEEARP